MSSTEKNSVKETSTADKVKLPLLVFLSFALGDFIIELFVYLFSVRVLHFYETVVGLQPTVYLLVYIIYAGYNMVNDPIVGNFADKPKSFWKKYGKRAPWIVVGVIGLAISFVFIFAVPDINPQESIANTVIVFIWFLVSVCLFDTFFSMFDTNYNGLIPEKFRTDKQRLRLSGFEVTMGILGQIVGSTLSPLLFDDDIQSSFIVMALVMAIVAIVIVLLQLYGIRESEEMKEGHLKNAGRLQDRSFFETLKICITQRSFLAYLLLFTCYQATILLLLGSIPYLVEFVLGLSDDYETLIMLGYIVAGLASVPIWSKVALKKGKKNVYVVTGIATSFLSIPFFFIETLELSILFGAILGVGLIGFWLMSNPILADVIDEAVAKNEIRQEGLYMGVRVFFARIALIIQALTFAVIHMLTFFDPEAPAPIDPLPKLGLKIQMAIVPMIIMLIGIIIFYLLYDITPEKKEQTRLRLEQLKL
ncbi:MAG: putative Na+/melibiose symporter-like transporter [Promethearchaeota archaeon]|nr:MAG: putative Na+/melibiose symporter-like transporter [Candidatus Lokiarchaeota archaeon]